MDTRVPVAVDHLKERDNVLIVFPDALTLATVPSTEANRLAENGIGEQFNFPQWDIPLASIQEVRATVGQLEVNYLDTKGRPTILLHNTIAAKAGEFLSALRRQQASDWVEEKGRESGMKGFFVYSAIGLAIAAVTALFYLGIQSGWINRAPSFVAAIHNILGPMGLLAVGGLLVLVCIGAGIKTLIAPAEVVILRRR